MKKCHIRVILKYIVCVKGVQLVLLSECIKVLRKKSFLTQEAFAKELGVVSATVNRWETGKAKPNMTAMRSIKEFCEKNNYPYSSIEEEWLNQGNDSDFMEK